MGIYSIKPKFQVALGPIKRLFVKWKIHPTTINILALLFSVSGGLAIYYAGVYPLLLIYIPVMAFVRTALNALDGLVAREMKVKNQAFGEVLNESIDRLSDIVIFLGIIFASYVDMGLASVVLIGVLFVSYLGIIGKAAGGTRRYEGFAGKADRMFYVSAASLIIFFTGNYEWMNYMLYLLAVLVVITIFQRYNAIRKELKR